MNEQVKRMYNATFRAREDGYVLDSVKRIAFINKDDFIYWKNEGVNRSIKFLQHNFGWSIILK